MGEKTPGAKERVLREHGLVAGPELPREYSEFIEGLSDEEVEVLLDLKRRLDDAGIPTTTLAMAMPVL
jgi:hypothetical protein